MPSEFLIQTDECGTGTGMIEEGIECESPEVAHRSFWLEGTNLVCVVIIAIFFDIHWWIIALIVAAYVPAIALAQIGLRYRTSIFLTPLIVLVMAELFAYAVFALLVFWAFAVERANIGSRTPQILSEFFGWYYTLNFVKKACIWIILFRYFGYYIERFSAMYSSSRSFGKSNRTKTSIF